MKNVLLTIILLLSLSTIVVPGTFPIEYQIQENYHRMKLMLNGDVRWNVSQTDNTFDITLMGNESYFIVKNINYNFRDGIIKKFNYKTSLEGTKKIVVELRNGVNDYHIYQDEITKNLFIEFYPDRLSGSSIAKKISNKKTVTTTGKQSPVLQSKQRVVNISQIVLDQVEQQPKRESEEMILPVVTAQTKSPNNSSAALWLILVSVSILLTGGGFTVYAFFRRRPSPIVKRSSQHEAPTSLPEFRTFVERESERNISSISAPGIVVPEEDEKINPHTMEFAEQYLRSQGELDLQQRLENMSSRSTQKKIGIALPSSKKKDPAALAQKLGLSIGELELVTRLQQFHKQHSEEVL